jgi:hypothetical protein
MRRTAVRWRLSQTAMLGRKRCLLSRFYVGVISLLKEIKGAL